MYSWPQYIIIDVCWNYACDFNKINTFQVFCSRPFHNSYFIIITSLPFYPSCHTPYLFFNPLSVAIHFECKLDEIRNMLLLYLFITSIKCRIHCSLLLCRGTNEIWTIVRWNNKSDYMQKMCKNAGLVALTVIIWKSSNCCCSVLILEYGMV